MMVLMTEMGKAGERSGRMIGCKDHELDLGISSIFTDCVLGSLDASKQREHVANGYGIFLEIRMVAGCVVVEELIQTGVQQ